MSYYYWIHKRGSHEDRCFPCCSLRHPDATPCRPRSRQWRQGSFSRIALLRPGPPGARRPALRRRRHHGKVRRSRLALSPTGVAAQRVLFLGAGKQDKFCLSELRNLAGAAARARQGQKHQVLRPRPPHPHGAPAAAQAAAEGIITGDFDVDTYRSDRKDQQLIEVTLSVPASRPTPRPSISAVAEGAILAESQNLTRELALEPSN